jgi:hypothetical protein
MKLYDPIRKVILALSLVSGIATHGLTQGNSQVSTETLAADFTHTFLVDSTCVHPQDLQILELRSQSRGAVVRTKWTTNLPRVASTVPGLNGSTVLALDITKGIIPENIIVTLVATDSAGNMDSISKTIPLNVHYAPIVRFADGMSLSGCATSNIEFRHRSFSLDGTTLVAYEWNFGDGSTSSSQTPTHSYSAPGTYQVSLTVTDNTGCTGGDHLATYKLRADIRPAGQCN